MAESKLRTLSIDFAVQILNLVKFLKSQHETIVANQIGRAGTSIGANIHEAQYAHGKPDFIAKLQIALKEANETSYWLELLLKTNYMDEANYQELNNSCTQIRVMLIKSINTAKIIHCSRIDYVEWHQLSKVETSLKSKFFLSFRESFICKLLK